MNEDSRIMKLIYAYHEWRQWKEQHWFVRLLTGQWFGPPFVGTKEEVTQRCEDIQRERLHQN